MNNEHKRMSVWIQDVKDSCDKDKMYMEECMAELLKVKEPRVPELGGALDRTTHVSTERSEEWPIGSPRYLPNEVRNTTSMENRVQVDTCCR